MNIEPPVPSSVSYEPVAASDSYRRLVHRMVQLADPVAGELVVDVGCGTGAVTSDVIDHRGRGAILAVDPDPAMVDHVRCAFPGVEAVVGRGDDIGSLVPAGTAGAVLFGNCIHLVDDVDATFAGTARALASGGRVALTTAFYEGAEAAADRPLYWALVLDARRRAEAAGVRRAATRVPRPKAKRRLTLDGYRASLAASGLRLVHQEETAVKLGAELVLAVLATPMFAAGALSGYPVDAAMAALAASCRARFETDRDVEVTRTWFTAVARKDGDG